MNFLKQTVRSSLKALGYDLIKVQPVPTPLIPPPDEFANIADAALYRPTFSPWFEEGEFKKYYDLAAPRTLVSPDRCYVLFCLARQAVRLAGDFWECGVYKGGTAALLAQVLKDSRTDKKLWLFDTFEGMPTTDSNKDWHKKGDFSDTSLDSVSASIPAADHCIFKKGFIPDTFAGLGDSKISFAHIDVDIYKSIMDSMDFIWPRLVIGGFIVFDDYGFKTCASARQAVDEFFRGKTVIPLCLPTGQCLVFKSETSV